MYLHFRQYRQYQETHARNKTKNYAQSPRTASKMDMAGRHRVHQGPARRCYQNFCNLAALAALAIFLYLKTLQRTDLFLPAILSGPGLVALLEATFILCAALLANFVGPSWVASQIANTYGKDGRPMLGAASFVILTGFIAGPYFLTLCYLQCHLAALAEVDSRNCGCILDPIAAAFARLAQSSLLPHAYRRRAHEQNATHAAKRQTYSLGLRKRADFRERLRHIRQPLSAVRTVR